MKIKAYLSHPIRGANPNPTREEMRDNSRLATACGKALQSYFPELDLYIPGEHDHALQLLYDVGDITVDQILFVDCEILAEGSLVLVYDPQGHISSGMQTEIDFAEERGIDVISFRTIEGGIKAFKTYLEGMI